MRVLLVSTDPASNLDEVLGVKLASSPTAWTGFLNENTSGTSCLGPLAGLERRRKSEVRRPRTESERA